MANMAKHAPRAVASFIDLRDTLSHTQLETVLVVQYIYIWWRPVERAEKRWMDRGGGLSALALWTLRAVWARDCGGRHGHERIGESFV